jgi:putative transposase
MTAPYSMDLRERALARKAAGQTNREIASALTISPSCVSKWTKRNRETGSVAPAQVGGYKPRTLSGECAQWLRERVASGPVTLRGLTAELAERGIKTQPRAVWVFLHAEGLSFKKNSAARGADAAGRGAKTRAVEGSSTINRARAPGVC